MTVFGFECDHGFLDTSGDRLHAAINRAEEDLRARASRSGSPLPVFRRRLQREYREKLAAVQRRSVQGDVAVRYARAGPSPEPHADLAGDLKPTVPGMRSGFARNQRGVALNQTCREWSRAQRPTATKYPPQPSRGEGPPPGDGLPTVYS